MGIENLKKAECKNCDWFVVAGSDEIEDHIKNHEKEFNHEVGDIEDYEENIIGLDKFLDPYEEFDKYKEARERYPL